MTTSDKIFFAIFVCILVGGLLFLIALTDYTWHYSGWTMLVKLGCTMPLVIWLLLILFYIADYLNDRKSWKKPGVSSGLSDDEIFRRITENQDHFAKVIGNSLRKKNG